ncbi:agamous-like MADS-box protein AGL62 [Impatiens glandulifera]|uniref:agamous-like MADS-box protein AGL62 n=1 Tax=Impatiens glandulifera TaxID=253017 RepID=UPI001FB0B28F|nr:agamous-like MADS-box protein AGL62 [Impatiens glandulifera]
MARKYTGKGRKKIKMNLINSKSARQVAFSKRHPSIFKKANELCILTGSKIAIIIFSPTGKPLSFGHPNVDTITESFVNKTLLIHDDNNMKPFEENVRKLNEHYSQVQRKLQESKNHGKVLDADLMGYKPPEMNFKEMFEFKKLLMELKIKYAKLMVGSKDFEVSVKPVKDFDLNALPNDS